MMDDGKTPKTITFYGYTQLEDFFLAKEDNKDIAPSLFIQRIVGLLNDTFVTPSWREAVDAFPAAKQASLTDAEKASIQEDFFSKLNSAISGERGEREKTSAYYAKQMKELAASLLPYREKAKSKDGLTAEDKGKVAVIQNLYKIAKVDYDAKLAAEQDGLLESLEDLS